MTPDDDRTDKFVIFPKLDEDFEMGVPIDKELFRNYLEQLEKAIRKIHQVTDLYTSNILWCFRDSHSNCRLGRGNISRRLIYRKMELSMKVKDHAQYYYKFKGGAASLNVITGLCLYYRILLMKSGSR